MEKLESFEILRVARITRNELFNIKLECPFLRVIISYKKDLVSFQFNLDSEQKWTFDGEFFLVPNTVSDVAHYPGLYHTVKMKKKIKEGTFETFNQKMKKLVPDIINHPKVRIKAVLFK